MKISKDIQDALRNALDVYKTKAALGEKLKLHPTQLGRYLSGEAKTISDDVWTRLYPLLEPYLGVGRPLAWDAVINEPVIEHVTPLQRVVIDKLLKLPDEGLAEALSAILAVQKRHPDRNEKLRDDLLDEELGADTKS